MILLLKILILHGCGPSTMARGISPTARFCITLFIPFSQRKQARVRRSLPLLLDRSLSKSLRHLHIATAPRAWLGGRVRWDLRGIIYHRLNTSRRSRSISWIRNFKRLVGYVLMLQFEVQPHSMVSRNGPLLLISLGLPMRMLSASHLKTSKANFSSRLDNSATSSSSPQPTCPTSPN